MRRMSEREKKKRTNGRETKSGRKRSRARRRGLAEGKSPKRLQLHYLLSG